VGMAHERARRGARRASLAQFDMVGFTLNDVPVRIMTDYVDDALTDFARTIVDTYTDLERRDRYCGYACRYGAPATRWRGGSSGGQSASHGLAPASARRGSQRPRVVQPQRLPVLGRVRGRAEPAVRRRVS